MQYQKECFKDRPWAAIRPALEISEQESWERSCKQCVFLCGISCTVPWSDGLMEDEDIDPCFEGVYRYLTGQNAPAMARYEQKNGPWPHAKGPR